MEQWHYLSAIEIADAIKNKKLSCVEILEWTIGRIESINPELNAIVATDFQKARDQAIAADQSLAKGDKTGPLHGVPITIKDNLEVMGMPCTAGASNFKDYLPQRNADVVNSMISAGAIVLGKTNLPRFAEDLQTYNDLFGQTNNPWNLERTSGGSSGGAAVAIATGLSTLEIGNDIGGSIRTPSHFCGVYGHKPTYGIVPDRGMVPPPPGIFTGDYFLNMDIVVNGPIARSAEDLDLMMDLMVQAEMPERKAWQITLPRPRKTRLQDFVVGIWADDPECPTDKEIVNRIKEIADKLSNAGVQVEEKKPEISFAAAYDLFNNLLNSALGQAAPPKTFKRWIENEAELDQTITGYQARQIKGAIQRHRDWLMRDAERQLMRQQWKKYFDHFDVMLCPAAPVTAIPHDHSSWFSRTIKVNNKELPYSNLMGWAGLTNTVYLPSTIAPVGSDKSGLPIGLQIVGPYLEDKTTIQFAALLKEVIGGFTPPPAYA